MVIYFTVKQLWIINFWMLINWRQELEAIAVIQVSNHKAPNSSNNEDGGEIRPLRGRGTGLMVG